MIFFVNVGSLHPWDLQPKSTYILMQSHYSCLCQVFYCHSLTLSDSEGVPEQLAALQAEQLRAADALAQVSLRMRALLRAHPLPLQLSFRVPLRAAALHALLAPEQAGRIDALHLWGWGAPLSEVEREQLLSVLRNQADSLRRLALEGHPASLLGTPGVDLRFLHQLTKLEVFAAEALRLMPAAMPQGLVRMVCTMETEAGRQITWAVDDASAPPGYLPHLDSMHLRVGGPFSLEAAFALPGVHVRLSGCRHCSFTADHALTFGGLRHSKGRGIFHTARSVAASGFRPVSVGWETRRQSGEAGMFAAQAALPHHGGR